MDDTTRSKKKRVSGWISIKGPDDLEKALTRMMNKILASDDPLIHAGRFSSLANAWVNCRRLDIDTLEVEQVKKEIAELRKQLIEIKHGPTAELENSKS